MANVVKGPLDRLESEGLAHGRVALPDKYDLAKRQIFVSGPQAVVRLLLLQKERDRRAGLKTAGFISGYPGSPLGGLDHGFLRASAALEASDIKFQPGLNEDLAATAIWGAQQAEMRGEGKFDGVFGLWYGKGPGVDRSGDVLRHVNLAGTSKYGGVVALMGDDHTAESSSTAHQSEFTFIDVMMPILSPSGVQEIVDYGLLGFALSRYAGVWVGLKCLKDTVEATASIDGSLDRVSPVPPDDFAPPPGGLNIRPRDAVLDQEKRLHYFKRGAVLAWLRANRLNKIVISGGANARIGVIAAGKSYLDVRQAMDDLGVDEVRANALGLRILKVGCVFPLEPTSLREFARGLDLIIVVEEKRALIEAQLRHELYGSADQPVVIGKQDEAGRWLFPAPGALDANDIAIALGRRLLRANRSEDLEQRVAALERAQAMLGASETLPVRTPYFCSGCPHNRSTEVPDGMRAYAGIGCHYMAQTMDRATEGYTHMGGEGANWIGEAPFSTRPHIIQNLGDGTYNHSGILAIRFAVAAQTDITYKILFNDAIAMTGGQRLEGGLTVDRIARQLAAENVARITVVTDEPQKYPADLEWPPGVAIFPREKLDEAQRALADVRGVSILIYDQTCAAEKRRRRKRGEYPDPPKRVIINELVCEGCGDCGVKSNCVSIQPLETEFGRKRTIDQSTCNKDFSCADGFCPAFVTVHGAQLKRPAEPLAFDASTLPRPLLPEIGARPYGVLITGIGGAGVVTIGAILGMAAHIEGKGCGAIDMAGLAQKGGPVVSHVKIAARPDDIHAIRVAAGEADLLLGCDLLVTGSAQARAAIRKGEAGVVVNSAEIFPGDFTRDPDFDLSGEAIRRAIRQAAGDKAFFVDASATAATLLGNSIGANMFMLGFAWQKGFVPLEEASLLRAIELNGEAVAMNRQAFFWGRRAAADPASVTAAAAALNPRAAPAAPQSLESVMRRRAEFLIDYQNATYAKRYLRAVRRIAEAEQIKAPGSDELAQAVARGLFKLMAIKDEYEVGRLYSDGSFARQVAATFDGDLKFEFHLAPPVLARKNAKGEMLKSSYGPWMAHAFKALGRLKVLRGTPFDLFGYTRERRMERKLIVGYERALTEIAVTLTPDNHAIAVEFAELPQKVRGFGHVKLRNAREATLEGLTLMDKFRMKSGHMQLAAE
ncbi:indolepyruvate ferredoxin oxidoreductase family protein [Methylocella silvestris]|uniref:indolepyruvate ferredoxin oxidoreductase family protein n=1 Tax=Methylocella silvestris TaxID=199596 RepID=UPI0015E07CB7|nr:indolepyruvate ferredoxin oxidoreductase family protein [Methylocella silvestris]